MARHSLFQAIKFENGRQIGSCRLQVEIAKFDTHPQPKYTTQKPPAKHPKPPLPNPILKPALRDHRSYKEVSNQKNPPNPPPLQKNSNDYKTANPRTQGKTPPPQPTENNEKLSPTNVYLSLQQCEPQPDFIDEEMSYARTMCSGFLEKK